ncbi:MAG: sigma-70 family RNA polymerase sigma factor [Candidatus Brocadiaceae bacterium]|nr:sigma-70 family RNA polymerase sigma factor [Candidatus Brocadiaceae bacterium]
MKQKNLLKHLDALYRSALYLVKNENNADDLVQETCVKALKFLREGNEVVHEKAWLFKILMNTFNNQYRKDKRDHTLAFDSIESFHESIKEEASYTTLATQDDEKMNELLSSDVKKALEEIPEDFRMVILLSIVEGFSYQEVSEIVKCPIGTVMSRIYRGRRMLKERLASYARKHGFLRE